MSFSIISKLKNAMGIYFDFVQRINAIATCRKASPLKRVQDMQVLLAHFAEKLAESERTWIDTFQFPYDCQKDYSIKQEVASFGLHWTIYLN
jgi:hypothetical protein